MKTSRIFAGVVATLALFAGDYAQAAPGAAGGDTVVLNTTMIKWVGAEANPGPQQNGVARIGKNTGAGAMDALFNFSAKNPADVHLLTSFTRSAAVQNQNANNPSWMQGAFAVAHLTDKGVSAAPQVDLPPLTGERAWMKPNIAETDDGLIVLIAASEDNGVNNNPQPVLFVYKNDAAVGAQPVKIPNSTRTNPLKPTNLIQTALKQGIQVQNPNNQRGPHSIAKVGANTFILGMQYNNQAAENISVTVNADASVKVNWLKRYSNNAQHCRPQTIVPEGSTVGYHASVEANNQPAEIGWRLTSFDVATGNVIASKIAVRSQPQKKIYVAEPSIGMVGKDIAVGWAVSTKNAPKGGNGNGHASGGDGGAQISAVALFDSSTLTMKGEPLMNAAAYGRHSQIFTTQYGPKGEPAIAYIGGSSTGTKGAFEQLLPLKADGTIGLKDPAKLYAVSTYSDVANVQARGKRNPNDQAKGFIYGIGSVPNPGYGKGATAFQPEVKSFSFSSVTGYTDQASVDVGKRNGIWLSLVPASWDENIKTTPGSPTSTPGVDPTTGAPSQVGPSPRTKAPATDPSGDKKAEDTNVLEGTEGSPSAEDGTDGPNRAALGADNGGCSVSSTSSNSSGAGLIFLAVAGVIVALRRKQEEV